MRSPLPEGETFRRKPFENNPSSGSLLDKEAFLRRFAYRATILNINESFFDDSDMKSDYFLVVVYDPNSGAPLLSSRYYYHKPVIENYLKGDDRSLPEFSVQNRRFELDSYSDGEIFLIDRLSVNLSHSLYRLYRSQILSLFYSEVLDKNQMASVLLMVRKEGRDQQLVKYLDLGFDRIGSVTHKGRLHHVILGDLKNRSSV